MSESSITGVKRDYFYRQVCARLRFDALAFKARELLDISAARAGAFNLHEYACRTFVRLAGGKLEETKSVPLKVTSADGVPRDTGQESSPATCTPSPVVKKTKGRRIGEKLWTDFQKHPERLGWTAEKWATRFRCSRGTICGLRVWKVMQLLKASERATRAEKMDQSRTNPKGRRKSAGVKDGGP
jgi:hypothetical protein